MFVCFTRSGETQYNKEGLLQGSVSHIDRSVTCLLRVLLHTFISVLHVGQTIDSGLSEIGLQQAEAAGRYLKDVLFTNVFASDMLRAQQVPFLTLQSLIFTRLPLRNEVCLFQTAEAIMRHNSSCSGLRMVCDPLLKERVRPMFVYNKNNANRLII